MKRFLGLAVFFFLFSSGITLAATLDELNNPLLRKNEWRFDPEVEFNYLQDDARSHTFASTGEHSELNYYSFSLQPDAYYGISNNLQLSVTTNLILPYQYDYFTYLDTGATDAYAKYRTDYANLITEELKWRPNQAWEFHFTPQQVFLKSDAHTLAFTSSTGLNTKSRMSGYVFTTGATWLSDPKPGNRTTNNRADLDGLVGSLLDKKQVEVNLDIMYSWLRQAANYSIEPVPAPIVADQTAAKDNTFSLSVNPDLNFGILDNLELDTGADVTIPKLAYGKTHSYAYSSSVAGLVESVGTDKDYALCDYSLFALLKHRVHPQLQLYVRGDYDYSRTRSEERTDTYLNGVLSGTTDGSSTTTYKTLSATLGLYWISKPKKQGRPLAPDLDGLKRPLLEKRQVRLDLSFKAWRNRFKYSNSSSFQQNAFTINTQVTYGLVDTLQGYLSCQITTPNTEKIENGTSIYRYIDRLIPVIGAGLTYRPNQSFEFFIQASVTPEEDTKTESYTGSILYGTDYDYIKESSVNVGATMLW
ncbi:MAG: hypothetical protein PHU91_04095 [Candidatus Omnitrophica bacterium]|nr:hypothetical protein [Candidatus Omnitrophota bacterium]MDD5611176.1 hypothetical protein [Candidatus Omnitrophota bacterium]